MRSHTKVYIDDTFSQVFIECADDTPQVVIRAEGIAIWLKLDQDTLDQLIQVAQLAQDQLSNSKPNEARLRKEHLNKSAPIILEALENLITNPKDAVARLAAREAVIGASLGFRKVSSAA